MSKNPMFPTGNISLKQRLLALLDQKKISYRHLYHKEANTCQTAARQRNEPLKTGGKTLLFKDKRGFRLFTLPANLTIDSNKVRKTLRSDKLRFATEQELWTLTGAEKGALPPFGEPFFPLPLYLDKSILENDRIAFNCGILTESVILSMPDYLSMVEPIIVDVTKEQT